MTSNSQLLRTARFDVGRHLAGDDVMANYLTDCFEEGGTALFLKAIGEVARARGMSELATRTGLTRASLYKALAEDGNPAFDTLARVLDTLGFRLQIVANTPASPAARDKRSEAGRARVMEASVAYDTRATAKASAAKAKKVRKPAAKKR
jgi:probable addiction module antidote protein